MKKFPAWRYKCDFCGKNGRSGGHMKRHEEGCTANPNRVCRIHEHADVLPVGGGPFPVAELVSVLRAHWLDADHGVEALREKAEGCPCCMLAAIRQSGAAKGQGEGEDHTPPWIDGERFNFKKELASLWEGVNERDSYERSIYE